jgi:uracil-DNA glycosylase
VGNVAVSSFLYPMRDIGIGELHGLWWEAKWDGGTCWAFATYHPAAVLRNASLGRVVREDLGKFKERMKDEHTDITG